MLSLWFINASNLVELSEYVKKYKVLGVGGVAAGEGIIGGKDLTCGRGSY